VCVCGCGRREDRRARGQALSRVPNNVPTIVISSSVVRYLPRRIRALRSLLSPIPARPGILAGCSPPHVAAKTGPASRPLGAAPATRRLPFQGRPRPLACACDLESSAPAIPSRRRLNAARLISPLLLLLPLPLHRRRGCPSPPARAPLHPRRPPVALHPLRLLFSARALVAHGLAGRTLP
jgi:hypothetical protein